MYTPISMGATLRSMHSTSIVIPQRFDHGELEPCMSILSYRQLISAFTQRDGR